MSRKTSQREAIDAVFGSHDRPLSPQEVLEYAAEDAPGLGIATVYRNIKRRVEDGTLVTVELPGQPPRYEMAGKQHHHHFQCKACHRLFEVDGCNEAFRKLTPQGFKLEGHDLLLYGKCGDCAASE